MQLELAADMVRSAKLDRRIEALLEEIRASASIRGAAKLAAWKKPQEDLRRLVRRDYVKPLRRHLGYRELKTLLSAVSEILSRLGGDARGFESTLGLREIAANFPVHFKAEPYGGPEGLALRGFYVNRGAQTLERPLIFVNTAHVPLAATVTFCHEFGHYLTAELFSRRRQPVHFFFDSDYASHLDDPIELAADALVSLRAYPEALARQLFATPWNWGLVARTGNLSGDAFEQVRTHVRENYGFDFSAEIPAHQNLHYLSGMIHYAKLRWALLAEYDL